MDRWQHYFMDIAERSAKMSYCIRMKVGAVAVRGNRPILTGWNGLPSGGDNCCEDVIEGELVTKPDVTHAERNLIEHAAAEGISLKGADLYITHSPCIECAKSIKNAGIKNVYYLKLFRSSDGIDYLNKYRVNNQKL
jgi:dCMP deaminase